FVEPASAQVSHGALVRTAAHEAAVNVGSFRFSRQGDTSMIQTLQEFVDARGAALRVDRQRAVIQGVKILGLKSRNGRTYLPEALAAAAGLYEGVKVNVNHPKGGPLAPRDYQ